MLKIFVICTDNTKVQSPYVTVISYRGVYRGLSIGPQMMPIDLTLSSLYQGNWVKLLSTIITVSTRRTHRELDPEYD